MWEKQYYEKDLFRLR